MGGVLVTPFEKDFKKIDRDILSQIYREVSVGKEEFEYLKTKLSE
jgi:dihydrodipicolinate synthase/N-acetylneuraminate lyase